MATQEIFAVMNKIQEIEYKRIMGRVDVIMDVLCEKKETDSQWGKDFREMEQKLYELNNTIMEVRFEPYNNMEEFLKKCKKLQSIEPQCDWLIAKLQSRGYNI